MTLRIVDMTPGIPQIVTPLWTLNKDSQRIDAELVDHQGPAGWELRMLPEPRMDIRKAVPGTSRRRRAR